MSSFVVPVPCLRDNYAYLVGRGDECFVVDPGQAAPVLGELERRGLELVGIFCTHHHADHVGGNLELLDEWDVPVWAHASDAERIPGFSNGVEDGTSFELVGREWRVLHVPGHTRGAVSYFTGEMAFTGDTLFCAGCGRLFEGTAEDMHRSLEKMRATFDENTRVYTGHEYTEANLRFAFDLEPSNEAVKRRLEDVEAERAQGICRAHALFGEELRTNPFLRLNDEGVRRAVALTNDATPVEVFAALRKRKDTY